MRPQNGSFTQPAHNNLALRAQTHVQRLKTGRFGFSKSFKSGEFFIRGGGGRASNFNDPKLTQN